MNKNYYCVIMAGGVGSRFWPLSRTSKPKQFLDILGTGRTLIQQTFDRFSSIVPAENILIVTNKDYADLVAAQLPEILPQQIVGEPLRKNTAPCIAYANHKIKAINPNATVIVAPSDHLIIKEEEFARIIKQGLEFVSNNKTLLTLGIKPSRPETGYGYIQINPEKPKASNIENIRKVKTFTEKPDFDMAKIFYESGEFYWNSGIFLWSLPSIIDAFEKHLPEVDRQFSEGNKFYNTPEEAAFIEGLYPHCKSISIDYGVMEKADNVHVFLSDFGWSDLGTWGSLYENSTKDADGNCVVGENVFTYNMKNCIVNMPKDKLSVIHGLEDFIVVESDGILLICRKHDEQKIKLFVNDVKLKKGEDIV